MPENAFLFLVDCILGYNQGYQAKIEKKLANYQKIW